MAVDITSIKKDFTQRQIEIVLTGLTMAQKSYTRRINAETDPDATALWQKKLDEVNIVASKMRLT